MPIFSLNTVINPPCPGDAGHYEKLQPDGCLFVLSGILTLPGGFIGGDMKPMSEKKSYFSVPFIVQSLAGLVMVLGCAYYGFKISGTGGALFGALIGFTIYGC